MKDGEYRIGSLSYLYPDSGHSWLRRHVLHFRTLRTLRRAGCLFRSRGGQLGGGTCGGQLVGGSRGGQFVGGTATPRENACAKGPSLGNNPKSMDRLRHGTVTVPSAEDAEALHRYYRVPRENIIVKKSGEEQ